MEEKPVEKKNRWAWLPEAMPAVARLMAEKRAQHGAQWVSQCWQRGVVLGEPGWLFAAEGSLTVGAPVDVSLITQYYDLRARFPDAAVVIMKEPGHAAV
jgi:hypothetical protein